MRLVVAVNPTASVGSRSSVGDTVVRSLTDAGHDVEKLAESSFSALVETARARVAEHPDALIVVGGDGMVSLGVDLVAGTGVPLGIVPSGTGNDGARALGLPHDDPAAALDQLREALGRDPRAVDAGRLHWTEDGTAKERWFFGMLSAGFDAIVNERANRMRRPRGPSRYVFAMIAELARLHPIRYRLTLDGEVLETDALLVAVGNGGFLGGGMNLAPHALLDDGVFDVAVVQPFSRIGFLRLFPSVFTGTHLRDRRVAVHRAARVRVEADVVAYADGERVAPCPIEAETVRGALRILL